MPALTELIAHAPWREATTYRDTWPHEYVLTEKDKPTPNAGRRLQQVSSR